MDSGLLATKLHPPSVPPARVQRPLLARRLNEGLEFGRQITLVSAPAGFGKTTCISDWVSALDCPVTWLSPDAADNDPASFFTYLVAALQRIDASLGQEIEGALRSGQIPPVDAICTTLLNDILALGTRFVLILDDLHVIQDGFILGALERLVTNLPPSLHLVLLTREDPPLPLARLRAQNRLTEVRARDLNFSRDDAHSFLNDVLQLSLSKADVDALHAKTEGWIAGLQLAGLAARDRPDPSRFIATLSGSHRFILGYLTEEVLSRQPEEVQRFLLQTATLDRLTGELCNAVTGRADSGALLEALFGANLFLIPLDEEGRWYRYHHLFADLLRDRQGALHPDEIAALHRRASHWYARESAGQVDERGAFVRQAIDHALRAADYALAVDLLEQRAMDLIMRGYAKTVNGWAQAIPAEWASASPRTHLAFAWMHLLRGAYGDASPYLKELETFFSGSQARDDGSRAVEAEWLVMQSLLRNMEGQMAECLGLATRALEIAPERDSRVRSLAHFGQACAYQGMDERELAIEAYRAAIRYGREGESLITEMMSTSGLAQLAFEHGQLHLAFEIAAPVAARLDESGSPPPIAAVVYGILGEIHYQWARIDQGRSHSLRALQLSTLGGYRSGIISCHVNLSRLSQLGGDLDAAGRDASQAVDLIQVDTPDYVRHEAVAQQVRVYLAQDRPAAAELALGEQGFSFGDSFSFPALRPDGSISHSRGLLYNSSLRLLLYQSRTAGGLVPLHTGIELADRLIVGSLQAQTVLVAVEALLLRAQMQAQAGSGEASRVDVIRALELAEPEGIVGAFVEQGAPIAEALATVARRNHPGNLGDYHGRLQATFSSLCPPVAAREEHHASQPAQKDAPPPLMEALTDRELDVLHLMARGLTYQEIADRLFISLNTVRSHVKAIYGKLGVNNRTQAVTAARQLHIL